MARKRKIGPGSELPPCSIIATLQEENQNLSKEIDGFKSFLSTLSKRMVNLLRVQPRLMPNEIKQMQQSIEAKLGKKIENSEPES